MTGYTIPGGDLSGGWDLGQRVPPLTPEGSYHGSVENQLLTAKVCSPQRGHARSGPEWRIMNPDPKPVRQHFWIETVLHGTRDQSLRLRPIDFRDSSGLPSVPVSGGVYRLDGRSQSFDLRIPNHPELANYRPDQFVTVEVGLPHQLVAVTRVVDFPDDFRILRGGR